jgi:hypothetical protein
LLISIAMLALYSRDEGNEFGINFAQPHMEPFVRSRSVEDLVHRAAEIRKPLPARDAASASFAPYARPPADRSLQRKRAPVQAASPASAMPIASRLASQPILAEAQSESHEARRESVAEEPRLLSAAASEIRSRVSPFIAADVPAVGDSLPVGNVRVQVDAFAPADHESDAVIEVSVAEETPGNAMAGRSVAKSGRLLGFSYEEELFRTKWGWAAFAEAQRIGRAAEGGKP